MGKTYLIIHDDNPVLVCRGGRSGKTPRERRGKHLPGGTNEGNSPLEDAKRELRQETGFNLDDFGVTETRTIEPSRLLRYGVEFLKVKVADVKKLAGEFERRQVRNTHDEPFYGR